MSTDLTITLNQLQQFASNIVFVTIRLTKNWKPLSTSYA